MKCCYCGCVPCRPFLVCPSFLQLLSHRCASYLPVHLCLLNLIAPFIADHHVLNV
jgi:hypothetical protein